MAIRKQRLFLPVTGQSLGAVGADATLRVNYQCPSRISLDGIYVSFIPDIGIAVDLQDVGRRSQVHVLVHEGAPGDGTWWGAPIVAAAAFANNLERYRSRLPGQVFAESYVPSAFIATPTFIRCAKVIEAGGEFTVDVSGAISNDAAGWVQYDAYVTVLPVGRMFEGDTTQGFKAV